VSEDETYDALMRALERTTGTPIVDSIGDESLFDVPLQHLGVTSMLLFRFVVEIEREFDHEFAPEDLVPENFESLEHVIDLLRAR
jgi:acyl carrier protein